MNTPDNQYNLLPDFLARAIERQLEKAVDEEFERAKKRLDDRKAEIVAGVVLSLQKQMDMQTMDNRLILTVKLNNSL